MKLPDDEQHPVDRATRDSKGWAMPVDMTAEVRASFATKGLIRYWQNRWQLTPLGFSDMPASHRGNTSSA